MQDLINGLLWLADTFRLLRSPTMNGMTTLYIMHKFEIIIYCNGECFSIGRVQRTIRGFVNYR